MFRVRLFDVDGRVLIAAKFAVFKVRREMVGFASESGRIVIVYGPVNILVTMHNQSY